MQEKPNSQSKVPTDLMRQFLVSSPGRPPAAVTTVSVAAALRLMAPTTCRRRQGRIGRAECWSTVWFHFAYSSCARLRQTSGAFHPRNPPTAPRGRPVRRRRRPEPDACGVEAGGRSARSAVVRILEHGPGPRAEVAAAACRRPAPHRPRRQRIGRGGADDAEGADVQRMVVQHDATPAMVSATGMLWRSAKATSSASASE